MEYRILENIGVENTGLDAAALNRVASNGQDGIFPDIGREMQVVSITNYNHMILPGEILLSGVRIELKENTSVTTSSSISVPYGAWQYIIVQLYRDSDEHLSLSFRVSDNSDLTRDNVFDLSVDDALYEAVLARTRIMDHAETQMLMPILTSYASIPAVSEKDTGHILLADSGRWKVKTVDDALAWSKNFTDLTQRMENLRSVLSGTLFETVIDRGVKHSVSLKSGSAPNVSINKVGGCSLVRNGNITAEYPRSIGILGGNLLRYPYGRFEDQNLGHIKVQDNGDGSLTLNGYTEDRGLSIFLHTSEVNIGTPLSLDPGWYYISSYNGDGRTKVHIKRGPNVYRNDTAFEISTSDEYYDVGYTVYIYVPPDTVLKDYVMYPYIIPGNVPATVYPRYSETSINLDFLAGMPAWGHGIPSIGRFNYFDFETGEYVQNVALRSYESGDENDSTLLTDGKNRTVYPLFNPVRILLSNPPDGLIEVPAGGTIRVETANKNPSFIEVEYDRKV